jgi:hypothetical protein
MLLTTDEREQVESRKLTLDGRTTRWPWLRRRRRRLVKGGSDRRRHVLVQLDDVRVVLERAREIVARGWVQNRWYTESRYSGRAPAVQLVAPANTQQHVERACAVGAVALAVRARNPRADLVVDGGRAIDYVWDAVQEMSGLEMPAVAGRAWPREARLQRIRDVARWNDEAGRSQAEILAALDIALSRVVMSAMREPSPTSR